MSIGAEDLLKKIRLYADQSIRPLSVRGDSVKGAVFSERGVYRYGLWRSWGDGPLVLFVLLNPSTADSEADDPTVRKCTRFVKRWSPAWGGLCIVNLFAYRSSDPSILQALVDPVGGPETDAIISICAASAELRIAAWGARPFVQKQAELVIHRLREHGPLHCLWLTGKGAPQHPLYLPSDMEPKIWYAPVPAAGQRGEEGR